jgi:hypothetical protein
MEKVYTCHDAVWILKNLTILKNIKEYKIDVIVFRKEDTSSNIFFIKLIENNLFFETYFEINTAKNTLREISEEQLVREKEKEKLMEYKTTINKNRIKEFVE